MSLPVCDKCQSAEIIAIDPGFEGEEVMLLGTRIVMQRGIAVRAWCVDHWPARAASVLPVIATAENPPI